MKISLLIIFSLLSLKSSFALEKIDQWEAEERKKLFNYDPPYFPAKHKIIKEEERFIHYKGSLKGSNPINDPAADVEVEYHYFRSLVNGPRPTLIVLPPFIGYTIMDRHIATSFAKDGFNVMVPMVVDNIFDTSRPVSDIDGFFIRNIVTVRMLLDLLEKFPEVKKDAIGGFGMSLGGIRLATLMGVDKRVKAGAFFIAGGDIPHTLTYSSLGPIKRWRNQRMKEFGINQTDEFRKLLSQKVLIDPLHFIEENKRDNVYMVVGKRDTVVPSVNQEKLWNAFGQPKAEFIKYGGHYSTGATYIYKLDKIKNFLFKSLQ